MRSLLLSPVYFMEKSSTSPLRWWVRDSSLRCTLWVPLRFAREAPRSRRRRWLKGERAEGLQAQLEPPTRYKQRLLHSESPRFSHKILSITLSRRHEFGLDRATTQFLVHTSAPPVLETEMRKKAIEMHGKFIEMHKKITEMHKNIIAMRKEKHWSAQ